MSAPFQLFNCLELSGKHFSYPEELCRLAASGAYPEIYPWWFIDASSEAGRLAWSVRQHDGRNLVPFAKVDDGHGDVACFDADSNDAAVHMLVLDESGRRYSFPSFGAWIRAAQVDAAKYR